MLILCFSTISAAEKILAPTQISGAITVNAENVYELMTGTADLIIIDSRKPKSYSKGHIQDAKNLQDTKMTASDLSKHAPDKSSALLFYCNGEKCMRSANAAKKAISWGYNKIYWFRGGWKEWQTKNMPVEK